LEEWARIWRDGFFAEGISCVVFDMSRKAVEELVREKAVGASDLKELAAKL
jgi:6-phosphogluconate dehydrogenase (decarboxylating)